MQCRYLRRESQRERSMCKGPEVGVCWVFSWESRKDPVAGVGRVG